MKRSLSFLIFAIFLLTVSAAAVPSSVSAQWLDKCPPSIISSECTGCYEKTVTILNEECTTTASKQYDPGCGGSYCKINELPPVTCTPSQSSSCTGCYERTTTTVSSGCTATMTKSQDFSCSSQCEITEVPPVVCTEKFLDSYRCGPNGYDRQREELKPDCNKEWVTIGSCYPEKCKIVWVDPGMPVGCEATIQPPPCTPAVQCSQLGCGQFDSCGNFCGSCPAPADNPPAATISVPSSAAPNSQLSISVTGTDDNDVAQLQLFDSSSNLLETFDCVGVQTSCSKTFTRTAPSAFSTPYTFKARSKDSANQLSAFVSGTGTTTAAPAVVSPVVPPPVTQPVKSSVVSPIELPKPLQVISVKFPLQPLFLRALNFPDSDCVRPGESALLAVKVQNTGKTTLKDVLFTATVPELGIRASSGPVKLSATDKSARFLRIDVPKDAAEGIYYLRFTVTNNKFKRTVHRSFVVGKSC